jgi:hypothetical protein
MAGGAALLVTLTACTSSAHSTPAPTSPPPSQRTRTVVETRTPTPSTTFTPAPVTSVRPLRPGQPAPKGEKNARCPYIRSGLDEDPTRAPNVADIEGNRVYRTTVLTTRTPVGCRFYFEYGDHEAVTDIVPTTFAGAADAHNALVRTAQAGRGVTAYPHFAPGVDGISYQTRFYGPDGDRDWAFAFAKGRVLVVVHTNQDNNSLSARLLGRAIVGKI